MIARELYEKYINNNYKLILSTGFSPRNKKTEEAARYSEAKKPVETSWNSEGPQKSFEEVRDWLNNGGWISAVLPNNLIAIDVDNKELQKGKSVENIIGLKYKTDQLNMLLENYKYGKHITNNGFHYVFVAPTPYKSSTKMFTKAGLAVTYRMGGASNIVVAPSNGRTWETFIDNQELSELPPALQPLKMDSKEEIRGAIACQLRYFWKAEVLQGNEDIDLAFMGLLVKDLKYDMAGVCVFFELIYRNEFDKTKTVANYKIATSKEGESLLKAGSFFQKLKDKNLNDLAHLVDCLVLLEGVDRSHKNKDNFNETCNKYAREYAEKNNIIYVNRTLYQLNSNGYYTKLDDEKLASVFSFWLGDAKCKVKAANEMVGYVKLRMLKEIQPSFHEFLMADGKVFNTKTKTVRERTLADYFFYKLNVTYNPDAKCERWLQFLGEIWPDATEDHIKFIQEFIGYIFLPDNRFELSLIFRGEGANGKSVLMDTIEHLIGSANISHISLSNMKQDFYLARLQNKLLNMATEVESRILVSDDIFKQIVSGEMITANIKFKDPIEFRPICKFIFASNNPVGTSDKSKGYERRIVFIHFPVDFDALPEKKDVGLRSKLYAEIDGIFLWAMQGLDRVLSKNKIEIPEKLKLKSKAEHHANNPVFEFATNYVFWANSTLETAKTDEIYNEYKKFAKMCGYQELNKINFSRQLVRVAKGGLENHAGMVSGKRGYKHMLLKAVPYNTYSKEYMELEDVKIDTNKYRPVTEMSYDEYEKFMNTSF